MNKYTASKTAMCRALARGAALQVTLPWPTDNLGDYASGNTVTGEQVDAWVRDHFTAPEGWTITGVCPGRTAKLAPVVVVTIQCDKAPAAPGRTMESEGIEIEPTVRLSKAVADMGHCFGPPLDQNGVVRMTAGNKTAMGIMTMNMHDGWTVARIVADEE